MKLTKDSVKIADGHGYRLMDELGRHLGDFSSEDAAKKAAEAEVPQANVVSWFAESGGGWHGIAEDWADETGDLLKPNLMEFYIELIQFQP